uniref:Uncharacterized protein n=1 Tax=Anopheles arabiensis TaxID=7173 RepID=A0A182IHS1_ANOAR
LRYFSLRTTTPCSVRFVLCRGEDFVIITRSQSSYSTLKHGN